MYEFVSVCVREFVGLYVRVRFVHVCTFSLNTFGFIIL